LCPATYFYLLLLVFKLLGMLLSNQGQVLFLPLVLLSLKVAPQCLHLHLLEQ